MSKACRWPRRMLDGAWIDSYFFNITRVCARNLEFSVALKGGKSRARARTKARATANFLRRYGRELREAEQSQQSKHWLLQHPSRRGDVRAPKCGAVMVGARSIHSVLLECLTVLDQLASVAASLGQRGIRRIDPLGLHRRLRALFRTQRVQPRRMRQLHESASRLLNSLPSLPRPCLQDVVSVVQRHGRGRNCRLKRRNRPLRLGSDRDRVNLWSGSRRRRRVLPQVGLL